MVNEPDFWKSKIEAFLCRDLCDGKLKIEKDILRFADEAAFALDLPSLPAKCLDQNPEASDVYIGHSLSGKLLKPEDLNGVNWVDVNDKLKTCIAEVKKKYPDNDGNKQFMALWRLLPDPLFYDGILPEGVRKWWNLIPADLRTPSVAHWEHQSIVSAMVGACRGDKAQPALLIINFSGTQDFISVARRTQDLWSGSYLISYLCWYAILSLVEKYGPDCIIQPVLRGQPIVDNWLRKSLNIEDIRDSSEDMLLVANLPNIFTAIVPWEEAEQVAIDAWDAASNKWKGIAGNVRCFIEKAMGGGPRDDNVWKEIWNRQTEDFLSHGVFWSAIPLPFGNIPISDESKWVEYFGQYMPNSGEAVKDLFFLAKHCGQDGSISGALYEPSSRLLSRLLSDRKLVRDFSQVNEPNHKCTLCGQREALHPGFTGDESKYDGELKAWWRKASGAWSENYKLVGRIRSGESLCAVCAVKRFMMQAHFDKSNKPSNRDCHEPSFDHHQFPSTAGVASASYVLHAIKTAKDNVKVYENMVAYVDAVNNMLGESFFPSNLLPAWKREIELCQQGKQANLKRFCSIDGEFLYKETYNPERLQREYSNGFNSAYVTAARDACDHLLKSIFEAIHERPSRYFSVIMMDGDNIGEWVGGGLPKNVFFKNLAHPDYLKCINDELKDRPLPLSPSRQIALSDALVKFAINDVRRIIEDEHIGKLIYAGGDDVFAVLPTDQLMPAISDICKAFRGSNDGFVSCGSPENTQRRMSEQATISAGAVIVHESTPLTYAMQKAGEAEHYAKNKMGRDSFAINMMKRSGAPCMAGCKWKEPETTKEVDVANAVYEAAKLMRLNAEGRRLLSSSLPYDMEIPALEILTGYGNETELILMRKSEFRRLAMRRMADGKTLSDVDKRMRDQFLKDFENIVGLPESKDNKDDVDNKGWWNRTKNLLILARMIAEEE